MNAPSCHSVSRLFCLLALFMAVGLFGSACAHRSAAARHAAAQAELGQKKQVTKSRSGLIQRTETKTTSFP